MRPIGLLLLACLATSARAGLLTSLGQRLSSVGQRGPSSNLESQSSQQEGFGKRKQLPLLSSLGQLIVGGGSIGQRSSTLQNYAPSNNLVQGQQQTEAQVQPVAAYSQGGQITEEKQTTLRKSTSQSQSSEKTSEQAVSERVELQANLVGSAAQINDKVKNQAVSRSEESDDDKEEEGQKSTDNSKSNAKDKTTKKKKSRRAKVTSSQSIRILNPGTNAAGIAAAKAGNYSRKTESHGQSMSKHKSEEKEASIATQMGSRADSTSVASSRHVGVDANQNARITSDSTGMNEILLTQESVAQKKKSKSITKSSGTAAEGAGLDSMAVSTSSRKSSSSKASSSQHSDVVEESSSVRKIST